MVQLEETGTTSDPRHADIMTEQMGLKGAKSLKIPGSQGGEEERERVEGRHRPYHRHIIDTNKSPDESEIIKNERCRDKPDTRREAVCGQCPFRPDSHNHLFKHLDPEGHMINSDDENTNDNDE